MTRTNLVNTALVELESWRGSIDANRNWAIGTDSAQKVALITTTNAHVTRNANASGVSRAVAARSLLRDRRGNQWYYTNGLQESARKWAAYSAFVGIAGFGINSAIRFYVIESVLYNSTVASRVLSGAVHKVLFAHGDHSAGFLGQHSFQNTSLFRKGSGYPHGVQVNTWLKSLRLRTTSSFHKIPDP